MTIEQEKELELILQSLSIKVNELKRTFHPDYPHLQCAGNFSNPEHIDRIWKLESNKGLHKNYVYVDVAYTSSDKLLPGFVSLWVDVDLRPFFFAYVESGLSGGKRVVTR